MIILYALVSSLINVLVSAGKNESWLYDLGADEVIICGVNTPHCSKISSKAQDGQALLAFTSQNYHRLSELRIAFVHGGEKEWHSDIDLKNKIKMGWNKDDFIHLGRTENRRCISIQNTGWCFSILRPQSVPCDLNICTYQGLQFVANGIGFLKLNRSQYEKMEQTCNGLDDPPREFDLGFKGCSFAMEYLAQYFADGPLNLPINHRVEL